MSDQAPRGPYSIARYIPSSNEQKARQERGSAGNAGRGSKTALENTGKDKFNSEICIIKLTLY